MQTVFGWWVLDPDGPTMVNRVSGQRMRFEGPATDYGDLVPSALFSNDWWRFSYSDGEVRYPLLVCRGRSAAPNRSPGHWQVDHGASAALWRRETDAAADHPPYGLWRRVDDCLVDAFVNWPELEATGPAARRLRTLGGWVNGAWNTRLERWMRCAGGFRKDDPDRPLQDPILEPLDALPPLPWAFFDADDVSSSVGIANIERQTDGTLYLPAERHVSGLDGHVPYLRRADGQATIFPAYVRSRMAGADGDCYVATLFVVYVDEDVVMTVRGGTGSDYGFVTSEAMEYGYRRANGGDPHAPERAHLIQAMQKTPDRQHPVLLRRLATAFVDGWLQWDGGDKRFLDDIHYIARERQSRGEWCVPAWEESGCPLNRPVRVRVEHSYLGGALGVPISCDARIVTDAQLERQARFQLASADPIDFRNFVDRKHSGFDVRAALRRQWHSSLLEKLFLWATRPRK